MGVVIETTAEQVRQTLAGDREAFGALYDQLSGDVQKFLLGLRLGLGSSEVDDAVQETFLRLLQALRRFDRSRPLRPFALGVARRVALELCRKRTLCGRAPEPKQVDPPSAALEARERRGQVEGALAALEPEQRTVIVLRHVSGLTMQELADSLGCSVPTARSRLRAAKERFAVQLRHKGLSPGGGPQ